MKNYIKRKPYGSPRKTHSSRGSADSPYLQANGNSNGYKRNGKNPKDQYNDFLNKAKDAQGQGDEVLEQFYLILRCLSACRGCQSRQRHCLSRSQR